MFYQIASQYLHIDCPPDLSFCLQSLFPYETLDYKKNAVIQIEIIRFHFPNRLIPDHSNNYSGFLTHTSKDPDKESFVFCFRDGSLLYGMQKEKNGVYHVYIHSHSVISCKSAIQYILLLECCYINYLGFHAVTVEHKGCGILFSAPSGTGKTTHTELWRKEFGSRILNGDFALIKCDSQSVTFNGTPFCGSSVYAERGQWPITDIIFLKQAPHNCIKRISMIEAITNTIENCFIPKWDIERTQLCMHLIDLLLKNVRVWKLECTMDPASAHIARDVINLCL